MCALDGSASEYSSDTDDSDDDDFARRRKPHQTYFHESSSSDSDDDDGWNQNLKRAESAVEAMEAARGPPPPVPPRPVLLADEQQRLSSPVSDAQPVTEPEPQEETVAETVAETETETETATATATEPEPEPEPELELEPKSEPAVELPPLAPADPASAVFGVPLAELLARDGAVLPAFVNSCVKALVSQNAATTPGLFKQQVRTCPDHRRPDMESVAAAPWIGLDALLAYRLDRGTPFGALLAPSGSAPAAMAGPDSGAPVLVAGPHELLALLRRWAQSLPADAKLLSAARKERRLWFRCECLRLAELPFVNEAALNGLLSALAPTNRAVLLRLLALFRSMVTKQSCEATGLRPAELACFLAADWFGQPCASRMPVRLTRTFSLATHFAIQI